VSVGLPIAVDEVTKQFRTDDGTVTAIEEFVFDIEAGEVVTLVGPTGCGKSTILSIILGVLSPTSGEVVVDGRRPYDDFYSFRGEIAAVFQEDRLLPWRTAAENAGFGLEALGVPEDERRRRVEEWFDTLGLSGYENAYPQELSGGMRQRVGLTRAYVTDPEILLLDEAFGHLDEVTATKLREDFLSLIDGGEGRTTTMFITHDIDEALMIGDRVLVSRSPGKIIDRIDVPEGLHEDPERHHEYRTRILDSLR
jgi:NitT/TauT family transport system ATP-binding protein